MITFLILSTFAAATNLGVIAIAAIGIRLSSVSYTTWIDAN